MPILLPASDEGPLQQGDLLVDITTTVAVVDGDVAYTEGMVLVVSRPCRALRAEQVVVAPLRKSPLQGVPGPDSTMEDLVQFFTKLRDGDGRPDTFYVGEVSSESRDRFVVKFDSLHTIQIPKDKDARAQFIARHRRFRLSPDFVRDLHRRLFNAFCDMGFDDERWWSDEDLKLVVGKGEATLAQLDAELRVKHSRLAVLDASAISGGEVKGVTRDIEVKTAQRKGIADLLKPLKEELDRRTAART